MVTSPAKTILAFILAGLFTHAAQAQSSSPKPLPLLGKDAWGFLYNNGTPYHPLSGMVCPRTVGTYKLTGLKQLDYTGTNVQCVYRPSAGHFGSMIVGMKYQGMNVKAEQIVQDGIRNAQDGFGGKLKKNAPVKVYIGASRQPCHHAVLEFYDNDEKRHSVGYVCKLGGYAYTITTSLDPAHKADFLQASQTFGQSQQAMLDHANKCAAFDATLTRNSVNPKEKMLDGNAFSYKPVGKPCLRYSEPAEDSGLIGLTWPDSKLTPMSFHLTYDIDIDANPAFRLQDMLGDKPGATTRLTLLISEDKQGLRKAYRFYDGVPTVEQVVKDLLAIKNGQMEPMLTATPNLDGGYKYEMHKLD